MERRCTTHDNLDNLQELLLQKVQGFDPHKYKLSRFNIVTQPNKRVYLLFNTRTGAFSILNEGAINSNTLGDLLREGYLVENHADEVAEVINGFKQAKENKSILRIIVLPAEMCNFRCLYCYESFRNIKISRGILKGLTSLIEKRIGSINSLRISWFGGEPLMAPDEILFINRFCQHASECHGVRFMSDITTNGYLLEPKIMRQLIEAGITDYQITLDGVPEVHNRFRKLESGKGTFEKVWQNLRAMKTIEGEIQVLVRTNFDLVSSERLSDWIDLYSAEFGSDQRFQLAFRPIFKSGTERDLKIKFCSAMHSFQIEMQAMLLMWEKIGYSPSYFANMMLPRPRSAYCYGGMDGCFVLGADGKLWKCTVGLDDRNQVGYLTEEGEIVFRKQGLDDWDRYSEEWLSDQSCLSCLFLPLCMGGCILSRRNGRRVCYHGRGPIEKLMEIYFRLCMKGGD